jgi:cystathionine beta-lyase/cystathionine gamma-synthase
VVSTIGKGRTGLNSNIKLTLQTKATKTYNDFQKKQRPLSMPIHPAVNFEAESSRQLGKDFRDGSEMVYQRFGHPTSRAAADKIALLEGAESALVFGSGMGAISTTLMALAVSAGAHVVAQREIFAQTFTFLNETLRTLRVDTTFVNVPDLREVRSAIRATTKLVYIESPSNPLLRIADIAAISAIAQEAGVPVLIDSTFASPYLQNPISLGASVVLHSATKFLAGHSDVMCGAAAGRSELIANIGSMQRLLGLFSIRMPAGCSCEASNRSGSACSGRRIQLWPSQDSSKIRPRSRASIIPIWKDLPTMSWQPSKCAVEGACFPSSSKKGLKRPQSSSTHSS